MRKKKQTVESDVSEDNSFLVGSTTPEGYTTWVRPIRWQQYGCWKHPKYKSTRHQSTRQQSTSHRAIFYQSARHWSTRHWSSGTRHQSPVTGQLVTSHPEVIIRHRAFNHQAPVTGQPVTRQPVTRHQSSISQHWAVSLSNEPQKKLQREYYYHWSQILVRCQIQVLLSIRLLILGNQQIGIHLKLGWVREISLKQNINLRRVEDIDCPCLSPLLDLPLYLLIGGWSGGAKVLCILHHWGVQLIVAYSWARPAILVVGKGRGGRFLFLLFLHFHSCSSFLPVRLVHLLYSLFYLFSPFPWETTQNDPQGLTCR